MAVFISVMPFPKSRFDSVETSLACLSIRALIHTGTAISLVRPMLSKNKTSVPPLGLRCEQLHDWSVFRRF
jgi:hypothetical protein